MYEMLCREDTYCEVRPSAPASRDQYHDEAQPGTREGAKIVDVYGPVDVLH